MPATSIPPHIFPVLIKLFPTQPDQQDPIRLLENECGKNLPQCENELPTSLLLRRIRFAALKVSGGDVGTLREAIALATPDWRDLLVTAGFANELDSADRWSEKITRI